MGKNTYFWDIETSTITTDEGVEMQVTYLSNVLTMDCDTGEIIDSVFYRTIADTVEYFKTIEGIVWVHNLDYELTFLLRDTQWSVTENDKTFLRDKNAPLQVIFAELPQITFRDTYAIFNKSVASLGEELGLPKLDYDYKKVRLPWDDLEEHDYTYNKRDNEIVAKAIYKYMVEHKYKVDEIPLTFTSQVRRERKKFITEHYGKNALFKFYYDRNKFFQSYDMVMDFLRVYQGGLTASIKCETNKLITDENTSGVIGVDIKSSYPNQMCTRKFPRFEKDNTCYGELADFVYKSGMWKFFIGDFTFTNIRVKKEGYILPISSSQMEKGTKSKVKTFNGKLLSAEKLTIPVTNIDIEAINLIYDYDEIICEKIITTDKQTYLREEEVAFLLSNFLNKELGINKATSKLIINSMYGVKVSNPFKDEYEILDGEILKTEFKCRNNDEKHEIYNNFVDNLTTFGGGLDVYSDGVFITSYARLQLVSMQKYIVEKGGHVVYSDTDSIKFYCDTIEQLKILSDDIVAQNKKKIEQNKKLPRFKSFAKKFDITDEELDIIAKIGIWEIEDMNDEGTDIAPHKAFITYGAKKYGYINFKDEVKTTIAGCNKQNIPTIINNFAKKNNTSKVKALSFIFKPGVTYDETASGRTTATKEKTPHECMHGLKYNGIEIKQYGGIIIKDTTYTLNMTLADCDIIGVIETDISSMVVNIEGDVEYVIKN